MQMPMPMKSYIPIHCEFHDVMESYATRREAVDIAFVNPEGMNQRIRAVVADVFSSNGEEFLVAEGYGRIRLDKIESIGAHHRASFD
jgi:transcriptional antiterminator Rof (Rho-off)